MIVDIGGVGCVEWWVIYLLVYSTMLCVMQFRLLKRRNCMTCVRGIHFNDLLPNPQTPPMRTDENRVKTLVIFESMCE